MNLKPCVAVLSELPPIAGHSGRLLRPDVWELHAAHLLLRLLTRLHLGEFHLGLHWTCVYVRKRIGAVLLMFFSPLQAIVALRDRFCRAFNPGMVRWVCGVQKPSHLSHSDDVDVVQQIAVFS